MTDDEPSITWRLNRHEAQALAEMLEEVLEVWDDDEALYYEQTQARVEELRGLIAQYDEQQQRLQPRLDLPPV